ncbi:MAG: TfoX/Sxy family protein [Myxococcales bacterium]|nr:TfoX/Sxy family protein [Myxococcales bacterium]
MRNIGPKSRQWLWQVGIRTLADLREVGAPAAFAMVKSMEPRATLNLLWGLEGAVRDCDWRALSDADKAALKAQLPLA